MLARLKELFSFHYNDRPLPEFFYELHGLWIRLFHDFYFRVEHVGYVDQCLKTAQKEKVIFISNHALTFEAALINYFLFMKKAGKVGTLVFPEAFKLPLVREFFRSTHCVPISVEAGARTLRWRHVLLFPEGMEFIRGLADPENMPPFHTGFLRMAKQFLSEDHKKSVHIVPIAHAGVEKTLKFWLIKNKFFLDLLIRPFAKYPYWVLPKLPFLLPKKVIMYWGKPIRIKREDLKTEGKIARMTEHFRKTIQEQRRLAQSFQNHSAY